MQDMHLRIPSLALISVLSLSGCLSGDISGTYVLTFDPPEYEGDCSASDFSNTESDEGSLVDFYQGPDGSLAIELDQTLIGSIEKGEFSAEWYVEYSSEEDGSTDIERNSIEMEGSFDGDLVSGRLKQIEYNYQSSSTSDSTYDYEYECEVTYDFEGWRVEGMEDDYVR